MEDQTPPITEEKAKNGMSSVMIGIALIIVAAGAYFFSTKSKTNSLQTQAVPTSSAPQMTESEIDPGVEGDSTRTDNGNMTESETIGVKTIEVEAGSFYFKPASITVNEGDKVKIVLKSVDMMHNFELDEFNVDGAIAKSGETSTVEFTASKKGTFEYYCGVGNHRAQGQIGKLIVR